MSECGGLVTPVGVAMDVVEISSTSSFCCEPDSVPSFCRDV